MNQFFLDGYLMDKVELQQSPTTGRTYCRGAISVGYRIKDKENEGKYKYVSNIFPFTAFGKLAESFSKNADKGDRMNLIGSLSTSTYTLKVLVNEETGEIQERTIKRTELIASEISITRRKKPLNVEMIPAENGNAATSQQESSQKEDKETETLSAWEEVQEWYDTNKASDSDLIS